ncbi:MAG: hypothetical protein QM785_02670 [Pyrinomonadaceae bacterium]
MKTFTNPLDEIRIASPCSSNWNDMYGNQRKRFCSECKLNVYNLSDMTRSDAESFLLRAEGRVCLRVYRRSDGSVITNDCPIRIQKIRKNALRIATAILALIAGLMSGISSYRSYVWLVELVSFPDDENQRSYEASGVSFGITDGILENLSDVQERLQVLRR